MRKENPAQTGKKVKAILFSVSAALFLMVFKLSIGVITGSLGLIASAVDSLMDALVSSVNLIAVKQADKPADSDHLYGHGKIESLAGLFQGLIITASSFYLIFEAIKRLIQGAEITHLPVAFWIMAISMILTFVLVMRLKRVAQETESIIIGTEMLHFTTDLFANGGIILALILVRITGFSFWDLGVAFLIACYILSQSFKILRHSVDELLDRALPAGEQKELERIILSHDPRIVGFHNLRTRKIGLQRFIDFHFEIRGEKKFSRAHNLTESLIKRIQERFPDADVTVHYDPEGGD